MKFRTNKEELLKTIQKIQNAVPSKNTLPILGNVLLETENKFLRLTTTDLDIGISSLLSINPENQGAITIPAKKFFDIIKELPDKNDILITAKKNNIATIECGKIIFKVMGLPKEEFPQIPVFTNKEVISIPQGTLKYMINLTIFAVSRDETRYVLNGILFVIRDKKIRLVATDGRRLAVAEKELPKQTLIEKQVIVPTKTVQEVNRLLKDTGSVNIIFDENQIKFDLEDTVVISRLIEGDYPNYEQVIPKEYDEKIVVDKEPFLAAIKRASLLANPDSLAVKLDITRDRILISKNTPYMGEIKEEIRTSYKGKDISIGFNPFYFIDVLKNLDIEKVNLEIVNAEKPGVIRVGRDYVYIVLPMQIV